VGVSDVRVNDLINEYYADLWDMLEKAGLSAYQAATTNVSVTPGTATYALQADFRNVTAVYAQEAQGRLRPVYPMTDGMMSRLRPPQSACTMVLEYYPACPVIDTTSAGDGTPIDGVSGWESLIVKQVARAMLRKESSMQQARALDEEIAELRQRIQRSRKRTGPTFINDRESADRWGTSNLIANYRLRGGNIEFYQDWRGYPFI
jgi:hypothetical protein